MKLYNDPSSVSSYVPSVGPSEFPSLVHIDGLKLFPNEDIVLEKALRAIDGIILVKYDVIELGFSECSSDGNTDGNFKVLSLGYLIVSVVTRRSSS